MQYTPHQMTDRAYWSALARHPRVEGRIAHLRQRLEHIPADPPIVRATDYLAAKRHNDRGPVDRYCHDTACQLGDLVLHRCLDGSTEPASDDRLLNWLWGLLNNPSWVLAAHLPGRDLPETSAPQLDLWACMSAAVFAETAEMLEPWLRRQSDTLMNTLVYEIDRRVLTPFLQMGETWWCDPSARLNNWSGVCAGSILTACASLANLGQPRPEARAKAIGVLNLFLEKSFTPGGECDEGINYWAYGVSTACMGWSRLTTEEMTAQVNLARLQQIADYPRRAHLFDRVFFSGNDAGPTALPPVFAALWLAEVTQSPWLATWAQTLPDDSADRVNPSTLARFFDALGRLDPTPATLPPAAPTRYLPDQQVALFAAGPDAGELLTIALTGGHNAESHNHNDLGHISLWHRQTPILVDLGAPAYTADFFGPKRYTYLSASSRGHACPIINQQEQIDGRAAQGIVLNIDPPRQMFALDLTNAYPPEAKLRKWVRAVEPCVDGYVVTDEFLTQESVPIENVFWSAVEPVGSGCTLQLGAVTLESDAGPFTVTTVDPAPHRLRYFNQPVYRLSLSLQTAGPDATFRTRLCLRVG